MSETITTTRVEVRVPDGIHSQSLPQEYTERAANLHFVVGSDGELFIYDGGKVRAVYAPGGWLQARYVPEDPQEEAPVDDDGQAAA